VFAHHFWMCPKELHQWGYHIQDSGLWNVLNSSCSSGYDTNEIHRIRNSGKVYFSI
jgi:hypothetical protein